MRRRWAVWAGLSVAASLFALVNVFSWYPVRHVAGSYAPDWSQALFWELLRWNLWLPAAAFAARWERRFQVRRRAATAAAVIVLPALHTMVLVTTYFVITA